MAKGQIVDRKELYRMICALSDADVQKAVSYVSFLRFVDVSEGKDMMELLRAEPSAGGGKTESPAPHFADAPVIGKSATIPSTESVADVSIPKAEKPKIEEPKPSEPEAEASTSKDGASESEELFDVGDFYTPVRSPRFDQVPEESEPKKPEEPKPAASASAGEPIIPRLMRELEQTVHSIFEPNRESKPSRSAREREEPLPSLFEPLTYDHHEPAPVVASEPAPAAPAPSEPASAKAAFAPRDPAENFFMPVRSQRFDQLRRPPEPAPASTPGPEARLESEPEPELSKNSGHRPYGEAQELSMFVATPEPMHVSPEANEKPKMSSNADAASDSPPAPKPEPAVPAEEERKAASMHQRLRRLLTSFRLTYAEVSNLFDAPTSVVYSWFEGGSWDAGQEAKLEYFLEVADRVGQIGISRADLVVRRPFAGGETFLEKLKRQKVTGQDLKTLKDVAARSEELRHKPKGATRPFYPFEEAISLYSTPLYGEAE